ncbi:MAG: GNAT family N-acetyltransferase [Patescibacteria group bacterium]
MDIDVKVIRSRGGLMAAYQRIAVLLAFLYPDQELTPMHFAAFVAARTTFRMVGAYDGEVLIGMATLSFYTKLLGRVFVIEDVVVDPEYRGQGIGTRLVEALIREARECGADFIDVSTRHPEAITLYEKLGFKKKDADRPFFALRLYLKA